MAIDLRNGPEYWRLRKVIMYLPGDELSRVNKDNYRDYLFRGVVDPGRLRRDLFGLINVFYEHNVDVVLLNDVFEEFGWRPSYIPPNMFYMRDVMGVVGDKVVLASMRYEARRLEPIILRRIISKYFGWRLALDGFTGFFEGGDLLYLDGETLLIGYGPRTSFEAAYQIGRRVLETGLRTILVPLPEHRVHLDGTMMPIDRDVVVASIKSISHYPSLVLYGEDEYDTFFLGDYLAENGYTLIDVPDEELKTFGANIVVLDRGDVVMYSWNKVVLRRLMDYGVDVVALDAPEIMRGGGGLHCTFNTLIREPS